MTEEFGRIVEGGEFVKPAQLNGHLVIIYPIGYIPFIQTKFSGQSGKPSDGIAVDVVDLDDKNENGLPGKVYRNSNFMQAQMIGSLKSQIGNKVLGTIGQGVARNGMNPPWVVVDMSGDPAARERASAWLQANPNFQPSPFVVRSPAPADQSYSQPAATPQGYGQQAGFQQPAAQGYSQQGGGFQQPTQPAPQQNYTLDSMRTTSNAAPPPQYAGVQGSAPLSQEDMTVLQHHRQQRLLAEQQAAAEAARQATFQDGPPPF
jgi:hypothetical protein